MICINKLQRSSGILVRRIDVFTEIEDALEYVIYDWNYRTDWQDNTFELCLRREDDDD